jgi:hypothetical protein
MTDFWIGRKVRVRGSCGAMGDAVICPTGTLAEFVSSPHAKNISLHDRPKSHLQLPPSHPLHEGRLAIVTNVGMGCGGRDGVVRARWIAGRSNS